MTIVVWVLIWLLYCVASYVLAPILDEISRRSAFAVLFAILVLVAFTGLIFGATVPTIKGMDFFKMVILGAEVQFVGIWVGSFVYLVRYKDLLRLRR